MIFDEISETNIIHMRNTANANNNNNNNQSIDYSEEKNQIYIFKSLSEVVQIQLNN